METKTIKTGILGLNERIRSLLGILAGFECFEIITVASNDIDAASKTAANYPDCKAYDDHRQMIIQNDLDLLIVSEPMQGSVELLRTAIKKKTNILKFAPPAKNFSEAVELATLAKSNQVIYCLANPWRYSAGFGTLKNFIESGKLIQPHLITANWTTPAKTDSENLWIKDPELSGGGVLLYNAYQAIDMIVENFGMAEQIYALNTSGAADRKQRGYLTEDIAVVSMRFPGALICNMVASRGFGSEEKTLKIFGKDKNILVEPNGFRVFDNTGKIIQQFEYYDKQQKLLKQMVSELAEAIISGKNENLKISLINQNLNTMAMIETAYLSARTAMPETPQRTIEFAQAEHLNT